MSNSLLSHGLQHTRFPCPSLSPRVYSDSLFTELVMLSNHLIFCCPLLLCLQSFLASESFPVTQHFLSKWPKYWSFSSSPFNEYSGLISFRIDWFDLAVQRTFKSLLQHHNSKASILQWSAFFMVQFSYPYMTTGKTKALTMDLCPQSDVFAF